MDIETLAKIGDMATPEEIAETRARMRKRLGITPETSRQMAIENRLPIPIEEDLSPSIMERAIKSGLLPSTTPTEKTTDT